MGKIKTILLSLALLMLVSVPAASILSGCKSGQGQYSPATGFYDTNAPADVLVVTVEGVRESALEGFDLIMRVERDNDAALRKVNPAIHAFAEDIRKNGQKYLNDLTEAKTAYQSNRNAATATKLQSSLAFVQSLLRSAQRHLAEAASAKKQ